MIGRMGLMLWFFDEGGLRVCESLLLSNTANSALHLRVVEVESGLHWPT